MGSSRLISRRRQDQGSKWARITMAILSTVGVIDTGSITLNRWGWIGSLSCPGGLDGCEKVLNSPWGTLVDSNGLELPLSFAGLIAYFAILVMSISPILPVISEKKLDLSRRTWWGLFYLSCGMSVFSLVLLWLMFFKIEAFCFFCVLSSLISFSLLFLSLFGGGWDDMGKLIFRGVLISLAVLLGGLIWSSAVDPKSENQITTGPGMPPIVTTKSTPAKIDFARYLTSQGIVQYSAYWCPHCHEQKEMFGREAAAELRIVECASDGKNNQHELCVRKGIEGFPSWEINGQISSGVKSLEQLSELTGYNYRE
ncbi:vitamin K epoxide reductase family protein [Prochlorococcus sp. MIT 1341]|uniref:vitamin K epoxide reductase family protein n=1 Tax=Prochlorococcus sp. MIT 1341 TaxID=3096221 RepID=UPI002A74D252|nr:vitamin K epoxide reductase family protein [Prochlorococcus sp. MIT 1341]